LAGIEEYALIGDTHSAGLISRAGSLDWLCLPRFDSGSCFAALLDEKRGGRWLIAPEQISTVHRAYREDSMVLESIFETASGSVKLVDCMPLADKKGDDDPRAIAPERAVIRAVIGISGSVRIRMEYAPRFDYGSTQPWFHDENGVLEAAAGPDAIDLITDVPLEVDESTIRATFDVAEGEEAAFVALYRPAHEPLRASPTPRDWHELVDRTDRFWREWASRCEHKGRWRDEVARSLLTLKAMTYSPTGGIVAAATTSLPEKPGGSRNWDYRYCWLRDATLVLEVLLDQGYRGEAVEWHDWLMRAIGGDPDELQNMYAITGERRIEERELPWLSGYEGARPVRIGNEAYGQFQLDVFGEVMDLFHAARRVGIDPDHAWMFQTKLVEEVTGRWREPDNGFWEIRKPKRHYVHSKVMAWVALDRAIRAVEVGKEGPIDRWKAQRDEIRSEVLKRGISRKQGCFVMSYGTEELDACLLRLPLVGFVEATDDRMLSTLEAIESDLVTEGLVRRYRSGKVSDDLPSGEGAFFLCTFWYVCCLVLAGRESDAEKVFENALAKGNDVGLFSEQYSAQSRRLVGNFPQAFSHFSMITAALALERGEHAPGLKRFR
jgi:GH15 family glucan-1,4-alpha-glucosidase